MSDILLEARVSFDTTFLEKEKEMEIPIEPLNWGITSYPPSNLKLQRVQDSIRGIRVIKFPAERQMPIKKGDRIYVEMNYSLTGEKCTIEPSVLHLDGESYITASFYKNSTQNPLPRTGLTYHK